DFVPAMLTGNDGMVDRLFDGDPWVDDPIEGALRSHEALKKLVRSRAEVLAKRKAKAQFVRTTTSKDRIAEEWLVTLDDGAWPLAWVGDRADAKLRRVRVYFGAWPFLGKPGVRKPLLHALHPKLSDVIA